MEIQLQDLIDQIKKDGVLAAETEADAIIASAKEEAVRIVSDAKAQAEKIMAEAKTENDRLVRSGEDAIKQAGRNLLISFRESVSREVNAIVGEKVSDVYSSEALADLIIKTVECWAAAPEAESITVILNSETLNCIEQSLLAALKERMLNGVTLKASDNFDGGFRIAVNGDGAYYDYSAESVTEMLSNYLSPKVTALLKEAE